MINYPPRRHSLETNFCHSVILSGLLILFVWESVERCSLSPVIPTLYNSVKYLEGIQDRKRYIPYNSSIHHPTTQVLNYTHNSLYTDSTCRNGIHRRNTNPPCIGVSTMYLQSNDVHNTHTQHNTLNYFSFLFFSL